MAAAGECRLCPGLYGMCIQLLLFLASMSVLVLKKKREERREREWARSWAVFLLDSSKQLVGAGWLHLSNLFFSTALASLGDADPCVWYWVNIMLDTTLGVLVNFLLLKYLLTDFMECVTNRHGWFVNGDYKDPSGRCVPVKYFAQLCLWLLCVTFMKLIMVLIMSFLRPQLLSVGDAFLDAWPKACKTAQTRLLLVMVVTPGVMNAMQFWTQDTFLKYRDGQRIRPSDLTVSLEEGSRSEPAIWASPQASLMLQSATSRLISGGPAEPPGASPGAVPGRGRERGPSRTGAAAGAGLEAALDADRRRVDQSGPPELGSESAPVDLGSG